MDRFSSEPAIGDRVNLETPDGSDTLVCRARIANLTTDEIWVVADKTGGELPVVGSRIRIILIRTGGRSLAAETSVRRPIDGAARMVALSRPETWLTNSRRANSRVRLALPAYLRQDADGTVVPARTTNISVGGFHCVTDLPTEVGRQMSVELMFTPTSTFECRAQVVRLADDPDDPSHRRLVVAFRFVDLTPQDEARVAEALVALDDETDADAVPAAWRSDNGRESLAR